MEHLYSVLSIMLGTKMTEKQVRVFTTRWLKVWWSKLRNTFPSSQYNQGCDGEARSLTV